MTKVDEQLSGLGSQVAERMADQAPGVAAVQRRLLEQLAAAEHGSGSSAEAHRSFPLGDLLALVQVLPEGCRPTRFTALYIAGRGDALKQPALLNNY